MIYLCMNFMTMQLLSKFSFHKRWQWYQTQEEVENDDSKRERERHPNVGIFVQYFAENQVCGCTSVAFAQERLPVGISTVGVCQAVEVGRFSESNSSAVDFWVIRERFEERTAQENFSVDEGRRVTSLCRVGQAEQPFL